MEPFRNRFERPVLVVADGAYAKRPFLKRVLATGVIVVSRLRKDAALFELPGLPNPGGRPRPRKYGTNRLSLSRRASHRHGSTHTRVTLYDARQDIAFKTFLATSRPAGGVIHVVIVQRSE